LTHEGDASSVVAHGHDSRRSRNGGIQITSGSADFFVQQLSAAHEVAHQNWHQSDRQDAAAASGIGLVKVSGLNRRPSWLSNTNTGRKLTAMTASENKASGPDLHTALRHDPPAVLRRQRFLDPPMHGF
jgi:hypothetical protein